LGARRDGVKIPLSSESRIYVGVPGRNDMTTMRWLVGGGAGGRGKVKRGSGEGDGKQHQISDCITLSQQLYTLISLLLLTSFHVGGTTAL